jgi:RNA polymerase sigma-70 factor (ECF subfamily)
VEPQIKQLGRIAAAILLDPDSAADVVQDALFVAWRELPRLRDPSAFDGWLRRILVNRCRNALRSRRPQVPFDWVEGLEGATDSVDRAVESADLAVALGSLSADDRVLLALYYAEDRTVEAIAELLEVPDGTIKSRLYAARQKLRRELEDRP